MPNRLLLLRVLKRLNKGDLIIFSKTTKKSLINNSNLIDFIFEDLINYNMIEIERETKNFIYYRISLIGKIHLNNGLIWFKNLPILEKIKLILLCI